MNLTVHERMAAWQRHFAFRLSDLPDSELHWERSTWQRAGAFVLAQLCDREFTDRRTLLQRVPGGATAESLDQLAHALPMAIVGEIVEREAVPVVEALRLAWWAGLRAEQAA